MDLGGYSNQKERKAQPTPKNHMIAIGVTGSLTPKLTVRSVKYRIGTFFAATVPFSSYLLL